MQLHGSVFVISFILCFSIIFSSNILYVDSNLNENRFYLTQHDIGGSSRISGINQGNPMRAQIEQTNFSYEQPVSSVIGKYYEIGLQTIQQLYFSLWNNSQFYNFSKYDNVMPSAGGEALAEAFSTYWLISTANKVRNDTGSNVFYVVNTLKRLNSTLVYDPDNNALFLPSIDLGAQRYALSVEANLYFVLDCFSLAYLINSSTELSALLGLDKNDLINIGSQILTTLFSQKGTVNFNSTNGLIIPMWEYNATDNTFYSSFNNYQNNKTSIRLTSLIYLTYLSKWLLGGTINEDEVVFAYNKYIFSNFELGSYYLGNLLMYSEFIHNSTSINYVYTGKSYIMDVGITALFLQLFSQLLKSSSNTTRRTTIREEVIDYTISLIGGIINHFQSNKAGFYDYLNVNTLSPSNNENITGVQNGVFSLSSILVLDYMRTIANQLNLDDVAQHSIQLSTLITNIFTAFLKTIWDNNLEAFNAGFLNGGIIPFIDNVVFLNLGVSNVILFAGIIFIDQLKISVSMHDEVIVDEPVVMQVNMYRERVRRLFPFMSSLPIVSDRVVSISSDSLNAFYELTIYPSDINRSVEYGKVFSSDKFNLTPSAENEGPNLITIQVIDSSSQKIAYSETVLFVKGHMLISGEIKSSDGQTRVTRGISESLSINFKVTDRKGNPIPNANYNLVFIKVNNNTSPHLSLSNVQLPSNNYSIYQTIIAGVTNFNGIISKTISVVQWNSSYVISLEVSHPDYEPFVQEFFIPFVNNALILSISNIQSLDILQGEESTRIQYTIKDLFGNVPDQAIVNVSVIVNDREYVFAKGLSASGEVILQEGVGNDKISIAGLSPGSYQVMFRVSKTLFSPNKDVVLTVKLIVNKRSAIDYVKFQFDRFSTKYGWIMSAIGGIIGFLGVFRNPIKKKFGLIRKCHFCGEYTSTKYPVCKNCGRTLDEKKD